MELLREKGSSVLSSVRDLHSGMVIFLPLRRAIGTSNLGRFHVSGRSYSQVALGLRMQLCTQIAVQGFKTVADGHTSIEQCRSSGRWISRGGAHQSRARDISIQPRLRCSALIGRGYGYRYTIRFMLD